MKRFLLGALVLLALAVLTLGSCAPAFLEDLNRAAGLTDRMTLVGTVGAISLGSDSSAQFYPTKPTASSIGDVDIPSGIVFSSNSGSASINFAYNTSNGAQTVFGVGGPLPPLPDPNYPAIEIYPLTPSSGVATTLAVSPAGGAYFALSVTLPSGPFAIGSQSQLFLVNPFPPPNGVFPSGYSVVGAQMEPGPGGESFNFLLFAGSTYYIGTANGSSSGLSQTGTVTSYIPGLPGPPYPQQALYGVTPSGAAYASYFNGSSWVCYLMTSSTTTQLTGITNRIDAVLTSGDFLSTQDGTLRVYDSTGTQVLSRSLTGLQYCYETYVGSIPYVFFVLPMSMQHGNWAFNVYAIPTSQIRNLGG